MPAAIKESIVLLQQIAVLLVVVVFMLLIPILLNVSLAGRELYHLLIAQAVRVVLLVLSH